MSPHQEEAKQENQAAHADFQPWETMHCKAFSHTKTVREERETDREHEVCASFLEHDSSQTAYCKRLVTFCVEPGKTLGSLRYLLFQKLLLSFVTQTPYELLRGLRKSYSSSFVSKVELLKKPNKSS